MLPKNRPLELTEKKTTFENIDPQNRQKASVINSRRNIDLTKIDQEFDRLFDYYVCALTNKSSKKSANLGNFFSSLGSLTYLWDVVVNFVWIDCKTP